MDSNFKNTNLQMKFLNDIFTRIELPELGDCNFKWMETYVAWQIELN